MSKNRRILKGTLLFFAGGLLSLILLGMAAYISNKNLPKGPNLADRLDPLDKIRLAEVRHLKTRLGEEIWPGWGRMHIPILLWHQDNSFIFGIDSAPPGWELIPDDQFQGEPYYRNPDIDPDNFAMFIGDQWVASMGTKGEADLFIQGVFRDTIPDFLEAFFPFRLLILSTEIQISGVLHETFHVFQANEVPEKFSRVEDVYQNDEEYWVHDPEMYAAWNEEVNLLIEATRAGTEKEMITLVKQFLAHRSQRRADHGLTEGMIAYERGIEWLEGLAKYVELTTWEAASSTYQYEPTVEMQSDPDFKDYQTFQRHWSQEVSQARRQATTQGDIRFYYTGMLQARILDKLAPSWKISIMENGVYLEDLLQEAVEP